MAAVVSSGVAVALFDRRRRCGGMCHYARPVRQRGLSTPQFAAPAIVALTRAMALAGSRAQDLEASLYGGGENPRARGYLPGLAARNVQAGLEILDRLGISVAGQDIGGRWGRKVVFHSGTGESVVCRTERVRAEDWYPALAGSSQ